MIDAVMYGMIPSAKSAIRESPPPLNVFSRLRIPPLPNWLLDLVDGVDVDPRHGDVRAEPVQREQQRREGELLADLGDRQRTKDRRRHREGRLAARPRPGAPRRPFRAAGRASGRGGRRLGERPGRGGAHQERGERAAAREQRHRRAGRRRLHERARDGAAGRDADDQPGLRPRERLGQRPRRARGGRACRSRTRASARSPPPRRAARARASPARRPRPTAAWAAPQPTSSSTGGGPRSLGAPPRATATPASIDPTPQKPSSSPVRSRWPIASSVAGTTTSTAPIDSPISAKTAKSTRTPPPRSAPVRSRAGARCGRQPREAGWAEKARSPASRAPRADDHARPRSTTSRCPRR